MTGMTKRMLIGVPTSGQLLALFWRKKQPNCWRMIRYRFTRKGWALVWGYEQGEQWNCHLWIGRDSRKSRFGDRNWKLHINNRKGGRHVECLSHLGWSGVSKILQNCHPGHAAQAVLRGGESPVFFVLFFFLVRTSGFESTFATLSSQELWCAFIYSSSKLACLCVLCEMQNITPRGRGVVQDHTLEPKTAGFRASYCKQDVGHVS